jgi:hypothetical protein
MEARKTNQIKTVLFILRIIDKEESYVQSDAFTPYTLTLARARAQHVPAPVTVRTLTEERELGNSGIFE